MECNRDEALRAKEIASKKLSEKDIAGARKFAIKAQNLYPELEGLSQMMATLNIYVSAEKKVNGEGNWYGILGVNPLDDEDTIRKRFRKLALMFHPDKNQTVGAEGAFKLISEAWSVLSDKSKKLVYDQRNASVFKNGATKVSPSPRPMPNGFHDLGKSKPSRMRVPKGNSGKADSSSAPASSKHDNSTFWTVCHRCKMQYEYLRVYLNQNLLCPDCREAFFAIEISPTFGNGYKTSREANDTQQQQNMNQDEMRKKPPKMAKRDSSTPNGGSSGFGSDDSSNIHNFQWVPFSKTTAAASAAHAAGMVRRAYDKVKRERQEAQAATRKAEALQKKNRKSKRPSGIPPTGQPDVVKRRKVLENCGTRTDLAKPVLTALKACEFKNSKDIDHTDIKQLLMHKARTDIKKRLSDWSSKAAKCAVENEVRKKEKFIHKANNESGDKCVTVNEVSSSMSKQFLQQFYVDVPDPDFHDFEKHRMEKCFEDKQVWAAYDNKDGMPRCYAMIQNVVSLIPFKMQVIWLKSGNPDMYGFSRTFGEFKLGRREVIESINCFSHKVNCTKATHGGIQIFPKRGEVWALYRNWSVEWNELTQDEVIHKYDMVEVLEDYDEQEGVIVIPLVKVAAFKTVFHRHMNLNEIRKIPNEEMSRFSHHVPSHVLTGKEGRNAPKGCRELDPAATPSELLQVMVDIEDDFTIDDSGEDDKNERRDTQIGEDGDIGDLGEDNENKKQKDQNGEID